MYYIAIYFEFFVHKESGEYTNITVAPDSHILAQPAACQGAQANVER
jgi:hypothetical protein